MENMEAQRQAAKDMFEKPNLPVTLKFEDVAHKVKIKMGGGFMCNNAKSEEKLILKGVSGAVLPGELLAILGPSGSGKTTLLTALGGRLSGDTGGSISYNGKPFSSTMKRNIGFVAQQNVFYPFLNVFETLVFTALLRLPNSLSNKEKILHAEEVVNQLGLTRCKDTIVGGKYIKGISGGERKRLSIGEELLINPSLLFLDEPTTGLDATVAKRIVSTLWKLARGGRTVLMTIHQPSSRLFYMFYKVMLLSEGNSIYFGKGEQVMDYFTTIGYAPSVAMNPSDFLLDLANGVSSGDPKEDRKAVKEALVSAYESNLAENLKQELQDMDNLSHMASEDKKIGKWSTTWWQQFCVLLKRHIKEKRHEMFSRLKIFQVLTLSLVAGLLWWRSSNLLDQVGLLFFYNKFGFFPLIQAIFTFPQERLMLKKERSSGMFRLSSYFMAKSVGDLPMEFALPTLFVTITYWMAGLKPTAINFFHTLFIVLYSVLAAQGLGLAIGAVVMKQKAAMTLGAVIMLSMLLTAGFVVQHMPAVISWIKYISLAQYAYKLLLISQYKADDTYQCASNVTCLVGDFPRIKQVGLNHQVFCLVALAISVVVFRLIAYVALTKVGVIHKIGTSNLPIC